MVREGTRPGAREEVEGHGHRLEVNITPAERGARIVVGAAGALTGALGHCPLYAKLGHVPASLKERTS